MAYACIMEYYVNMQAWQILEPSNDFEGIYNAKGGYNFSPYSKVAKMPKQNSHEKNLVTHNIRVSCHCRNYDIDPHDCLPHQLITRDCTQP